MLTFITLCLFVLCVTFLVCLVRYLSHENAALRRDRDEFLKQHWQLGLARYHVSTLLTKIEMEESQFCDKRPVLEHLAALKTMLNG